MSFKAYEEYKDSGVEWLGKIPKHWDVKRIRFIADLNPSKSEVSFLPGDTPTSFIPMEAVSEQGELTLNKEAILREALNGYTYVREGDVTYAKITPCFENGKGAIMQGLKNRIGFATTELTVLRPKNGVVTSNYLYRIISSEPFNRLGEASMYGAGGQKRVPDDFARNFAIGWPPLPEQYQLQTFLDHETARIDALIEEQKRLIALLKEKRQAVISHAVTKGLDPNVPMKDSGVEWLGEVPAHWPLKRMRFLATLNPPKSEVRHFPSTREVSFIPMEAVGEEGSLDLSQARPFGKVIDGYTYLSEGDVTFAKITPCFENGKGAIMRGLREGVGFGTTELTVARPDTSQVTGDYLYRVITSRPFRELGESHMYGAGGQKRVPDDFLRNFELAWPPISEQAIITTFLDQETVRIDDLVKEGYQSISLLHERRSALISATVTGKIDVRDWQPQTAAEPAEASV